MMKHLALVDSGAACTVAISRAAGSS
jgi:hypothetical protein